MQLLVCPSHLCPASLPCLPCLPCPALPCLPCLPRSCPALPLPCRALPCPALPLDSHCPGLPLQSLMQHYGLREPSLDGSGAAGCCPQTYALGLKEVWEVPAEQHEPGLADPHLWATRWTAGHMGWLDLPYGREVGRGGVQGCTGGRVAFMSKVSADAALTQAANVHTALAHAEL